MKKKITSSKYYQIIFSLMTAAAIFAATFAVILYAKGYRIEQTGLRETGQLVLKSQPDAASVFINGKFVAATNSTMNLEPGEYDVRIVKDGYFPWEKKLKIEKQVVTPTDAILFPTAPELRRFTSVGAINPTLSLDRTKIAYGVASSSAYPPKNGVYVSNIDERSFVFASGGVQFLAKDTDSVQFSAGKFLFSPDGKQLLVYFENEPDKKNLNEQENLVDNTRTEYGGIDLNLVSAAFLLDTAKQGQEDSPDVTLTLSSILDSWQKERKLTESLEINSLKKSLQKIASSSFEILEFTQDETKFIYRAKENVEIPVLIKPPLVGVNSTPESRKIEKGKFYVYDIREDRNYLIREPGEKIPMWLDTNRHYLTFSDTKIYVTEYDGENKTAVYSGHIENKFVAPAPRGNRVYFLTSFSSDTPLNLYALILR